ncbi:MAG: DUF1648 domain-containing protein [Lachnospiraceae bacterium]|nr:DUF1648 domain-containing protein [Lachnospiraceae bacterium]
MSTQVTKRIMWIISFISLVGTAVAVLFLPDSIPMHRDFAGNIDRWGSRYESFIFPAIILLMSFHWNLFVIHYEKKAGKAEDEKEAAEARANAKVIGIVGLAMAAVFTIMQAFELYNDYKMTLPGASVPEIDTARISGIIAGIFLIVLGNFMTKTRINGTVGVRVGWSMYNDNTWRRSNRFGAYAYIIVGLVSVVLAAVVEKTLIALVGMLVLVLLATGATIWYAHKVYVQEINSEKAGKE